MSGSANHGPAPTWPLQGRPRLGWLLVFSVIAGIALNWPAAWLLRAYSHPPSNTFPTPILRADSAWPGWLENDWPAFSTFMTPERLKLVEEARGGTIPVELACRTSPTAEQPRDCVEVRHRWLGFTRHYWNAVEHGGADYSVGEMYVGVPFRSVMEAAGGDTRATVNSVLYRLGPMGSLHLFGEEYPLYRPWWPGLIANGVIYGVLLWLPWVAWSAMRASVRKSRGQCTWCGYEVSREMHVCPECGCTR